VKLNQSHGFGVHTGDLGDLRRLPPVQMGQDRKPSSERAVLAEPPPGQLPARCPSPHLAPAYSGPSHKAICPWGNLEEGT
jgi:hypothetical protein